MYIGDRMYFGILQVVDVLFLSYRSRSNLSREDGKPSNKSVDAGAKVLVIDAFFSRVHGNQGISNNIFEEGTDVNLSKDESKGIAVWITEHNKFVARCRFVHVEFVCRCTVVDKLFISSRHLSDHIPQRQNDTIHQLRLLVEWQTSR